MNKSDIQLKMLYKFLSLFNLNTTIKSHENVIYKMKAGNIILLYDNDLNPVGRVYTDDADRIIVEAMFKDYCFYAMSKDDNTDEYGFDYTLKNSDSTYVIDGEYTTKLGIKYDGLVIKNKLMLYENGKFIGKCVFDTLKNMFKIYNKKTNNYVRYINNEFFHNNNGKVIRIDNEFGDFIYQVISEDESENICGYSQIKDYGKTYDYTSCELEFRTILEEIDEEYFDFLTNQKEIFNTLQDDLFENMACTSLKNFNKKQLDAMLDIDFSKFAGRKKVKKS